ncbi:15395_t:CDS:1, partial [Gigaspora rosea]
VYDYLTGKYITRLSYGVSEKQKRAKIKNHLRSFYVSQHDYSDSEQEWSEEYDDEYDLWDETEETEDCVSYQDAITNIIINPLKESCPCGNTDKTGGFSITTLSVDEKVYFWKIRSVMDFTCMT